MGTMGKDTVTKIVQSSGSRNAGVSYRQAGRQRGERERLSDVSNRPKACPVPNFFPEVEASIITNHTLPQPIAHNVPLPHDLLVHHHHA
jgi:hypothetical protein